MKYKTKPVEIEAVEYQGDNEVQIIAWSGGKIEKGLLNNLIIPTLEGEMKASVGDFIIKGLKGEFYPCKPDIFEMKYEIIT